MTTSFPHSRLIASLDLPKGKSFTDEFRQAAAFNPRTVSRTAFVRIETIADFHDALLLFLEGVNVSYEPVTGSLSGFAKPLNIEIPMDIVTTRRVSRAPKRLSKRHGVWLMTVQPTTASLVSTFTRMLSQKERRKSLQIDLTGLPPGDFAQRAQTAFCGAANLLNWRAGRPLSACDIADLFEWFADLSLASLDGQIPYGAPEWGPFIQRSTTYHLIQQSNPVVTGRANRTLIAHCRPDQDDLTALFDWSAKSGRSFGLINAQTYAPIRPDDGISKGYVVGIPHAFAGMSPDKSLRLVNHGVVRTVAGDLSGATTIEEARMAAGLIARYGYRETLRSLESDLAPVWTEQRDFHRPIAIRLDGVDPSFSIRGDLINHADQATYVHARELKLTYCDRVQLDVAPEIETPSIDRAAEIFNGWGSFVAANFRP